MTSARPARGAAAVSLEPRRIEMGRARIYHYDVGSGPVLLLLHGFNHHADAWIRNIGPLAQAGYRVVAIDLPGFGRSGVPRMSYSLRGYSDFMVRLLDALDAPQAHLVGSSMGGAIALRAAIDYPDRVLTVTGVDTAGMFSQVPWHWTVAANPLARMMVRPFLGRRRLIEWSHGHAYHDSSLSSAQQTDVMVEAWVQPGYKEHILGMAETMLARPGDELLWDALPRLAKPVLIVWGRQDHTIPVQHAYRAVYRIQGAELIIYDRCGHLPMYEKAEEFNRDLVDFLGRQPSVAAPARRRKTAAS